MSTYNPSTWEPLWGREGAVSACSMKCKSVSMGMPSQPSNPYPSLLDTSMLISLSLLTTAGDVREEPQRNLTTSSTAAQAQVTTTFCVLGLSICSYYLLCVGLRDLLFRPSPVSLFNLLFSVFTTVSANNSHRQLRGSENSRWAELPANAIARSSGNQRLTGGQRAKRPHCWPQDLFCPVPKA